MNLNNLIALLIVGGVTWTQKDQVAELTSRVADVARVAVVKHELTNLRTAFQAEVAAGKLRGVIEKKGFAGFIRETGSAIERDPAMDLWGRPYALRQDSGSYYLLSVGPDGTEGSEDDIIARVPK